VARHEAVRYAATPAAGITRLDRVIVKRVPPKPDHDLVTSREGVATAGRGGPRDRRAGGRLAAAVVAHFEARGPPGVAQAAARALGQIDPAAARMVGAE
jgi:hypothetical protein